MSMKKEHVYYAIIAAGGVAVLALILMYVVPWGDGRPLTVERCRQMLTEGTTPQERAAGAAGLGHLRDPDSVPLLLKAMDDPEVVVRGRAANAVRTILGVDFFFKAEERPEKRRAVIQKYRGLYEQWMKKKGRAEAAREE
jgi:hypothetical protein